MSAIVSLLRSPVVLPDRERPWGCGHPRTRWSSASSGRGLSLKMETLRVFLPQLCSCCPHSHQINVWDKLLFFFFFWLYYVENKVIFIYMCYCPVDIPLEDDSSAPLVRPRIEILFLHLHLVFHVELPPRRRKQAVDPAVTGSRSQGERWMALRRPSGRQKRWTTSSISLKSPNS